MFVGKAATNYSNELMAETAALNYNVSKNGIKKSDLHRVLNKALAMQLIIILKEAINKEGLGICYLIYQ